MRQILEGRPFGDQDTGDEIDRAGSESQRAVDQRVRVEAVPLVTGELGKSAVLHAAAVEAVGKVLAGLNISTPHVAIDDDGTPYADAGSRTMKVEPDTDGAPAIFA